MTEFMTVLTMFLLSLVPVLLNYDHVSLSLVPVLLNYDLRLTSDDPQIRPPTCLIT